MLTRLKHRAQALEPWQAGTIIACATFVSIIAAWLLLLAFEQRNARKHTLALWY
ncbi:MAG: hypothetical protein KGL39_42835 [Patescibacteria group bacterium]|nr:hypothetical protein [Patescibacteria group bacterium]